VLATAPQFFRSAKAAMSGHDDIPAVSIPGARKRRGLWAVLSRYLVVGCVVWILLLAVLAPWNFFCDAHFLPAKTS
jgi:hypothetical protein